MKELKTTASAKSIAKSRIVVKSGSKELEKLHPAEHKLLLKGEVAFSPCHIQQILDYVHPICAKLSELNEKLIDFSMEKTELLLRRLDDVQAKLSEFDVSELQSNDLLVSRAEFNKTEKLEDDHQVDHALAKRELDWIEEQCASAREAEKVVLSDLREQSERWHKVRQAVTDCEEVDAILKDENVEKTCSLSYLHAEMANLRASQEETSIMIQASQQDILAVQRLHDQLLQEKTKGQLLQEKLQQDSEVRSALNDLNQKARVQIEDMTTTIEQNNIRLENLLEIDEKCEMQIDDLEQQLQRSERKYEAAKQLYSKHAREVEQLQEQIEQREAEYNAQKEVYLCEMESLLGMVAGHD